MSHQQTGWRESSSPMFPASRLGTFFPRGCAHLITRSVVATLKHRNRFQVLRFARSLAPRLARPSVSPRGWAQCWAMDESQRSRKRTKQVRTAAADARAFASRAADRVAHKRVHASWAAASSLGIARLFLGFAKDSGRLSLATGRNVHGDSAHHRHLAAQIAVLAAVVPSSPGLLDLICNCR